MWRYIYRMSDWPLLNKSQSNMNDCSMSWHKLHTHASKTDEDIRQEFQVFSLNAKTGLRRREYWYSAEEDMI
jgi:hypothetical protein